MVELTNPLLRAMTMAIMIALKDDGLADLIEADEKEPEETDFFDDAVVIEQR